jgi:hypothetical protein
VVIVQPVIAGCGDKDNVSFVGLLDGFEKQP